MSRQLKTSLDEAIVQATHELEQCNRGIEFLYQKKQTSVNDFHQARYEREYIKQTGFRNGLERALIIFRNVQLNTPQGEE